MTTAQNHARPLERSISRGRHVAGTVGVAALIVGVSVGALTGSVLLGLVFGVVTVVCVLLAEVMI
ncbi:hypothetical protein ACWDTG_15150 [Rhodococcus zopfii]|uniref:hypothetical protein n=1 Tax=Rhodococcus zopfii TaxID=43772 RepID=UPI001111506C|nr:hypothetical protein [Rhodococcus zopfii]